MGGPLEFERPICYGCEKVIAAGVTAHSFFAHMGPMFRCPVETFRFFWHVGCTPGWVLTKDVSW